MDSTLAALTSGLGPGAGGLLALLEERRQIERRIQREVEGWRRESRASM